SVGSTDPYEKSRKLFQDVTKENERLGKVYNDAFEQARQQKMDDSRFLQVIERDVLPPWRMQIQRLTEAKGLSAADQRYVNQYGDGLKAQEESWVLLCRAIRENSEQLAQEGVKKSQQAEQLAKQFWTDATPFYSRPIPRHQESWFWLVVIG